MAYSEAFARVYDEFTMNADYLSRVQYIHHFLHNNNIDNGLLLDLACGTGTFSVEFAKRGFDVIGIDISEDMLSVARQKSLSANCDILYLCQDMTQLDLYGTVKAVICNLDSLNHLDNIQTFQTTLNRVSLFLEDNGVFIFDMNTLYKHRVVLSDNSFVYENENSMLVWQNYLNDDNCSVDIYIDVFTENVNGSYARESEEFREIAFSQASILKCLKKAGFNEIAVYGDLSFLPPKKQEERIYFVAKKGE